MPDPYRIMPLVGHDRGDFSCGVGILDRYLKEQATQDMRRNISNCFVAVDSRDQVVAYYTFAAANVLASEIPPDIIKNLPRYPYLPAALIGRLAVDRRFQRQRLGEALVADAARRAVHSPPAVFDLVVDTKNERAEAFYERLGFRRFATRPSSLFLPLATAMKIWR